MIFGKKAKCGGGKIPLPYFFLIILSATSFSSFSQDKVPQGLLKPSTQLDKSRLVMVVAGEAAITAAATTALYLLWYKGFKHSRFHFFNDNQEWLNMDKLGHATSAYNIAAAQYDVLRWTGVDNKKATFAAGLSALGYMSIIEVLDGFSQKWGFSKGDMVANLFGAAAFATQQDLWRQQRIQLRMSFHNSVFAEYNPKELGKNFLQRLLKDYNGQTYWASLNVSSFMHSSTSVPKWMTADIGYGAEGMTGARINPTMIDDKPLPTFERYRKILFGIGGEFKKEGEVTPYPFWLNFVRLPSPALEFKLRKPAATKFNAFYF